MKEKKLPYGNSVVSFENMEDYFAYAKVKEAEANAAVLPQQREIDWGDYVVRFVPGLVIWGEIPTFDDVCASERTYYPEVLDAESAEEYNAIVAGLKDRYERGYRFGRFSSEIEPGEWGDAHISTLWKISKEDYEVAMRNDWKLWPEIALRLSSEFTRARATTTERDERDEQDH